MKIDLHCHTCAIQEHELRLVKFSVNDTGVYPAECPEGHKTRVYLLNPKFELLFESGANALLDGYPLQGVAAFAAAFERFQEFYTRVIFVSRHLQADTVADALKKHINRAERQIGAYMALYLIENGSLPKLLPEKMVNLRNKVVHQGYFPSEDEAIAFGQVTFDLIVEGYHSLKERYQEGIAQVGEESLLNQFGPLNAVNHEGEPMTYTMLTLVRDCVEYPNIPVDLRKGFDALRSRRNR